MKEGVYYNNTHSRTALHIKNPDCWKCITPFHKQIKNPDSNSNPILFSWRVKWAKLILNLSLGF